MQITDPHSFEQWCNAFNIVLTDGDCNFDVQKSPDLSVLPNLVVPEEISLNPCVQNCIKFVKSLNVQEESQQIHIDSIPPEKPVFTQQLVIEQPPVEERNEQIIQKVVISEERPLKLPDQVTEVPQILRIPEIPKPIPKKEKAEALAIPSPPLKNAKEITEKIEDKIRYSEISAMIPNSIPQMSFSTVLLIADDGSPSSNYAINKFDFIDSQTAICGKLTNQSSICYILVTRNRDHPTISSILNCQEIYPLEYSQVPVITFKEDFGFSSRCAFLSCLRRSIIEGIIEFRPFDVSYLVITILSRIREIVLTSSWRNSTANSVLSLFNNGFELISKSLLSEEFISFLIPFEHGLLTYEMIEKYSFQIKGMRMKLLSTVQSNQRLQGTSWPMHITQAMKLNVPKFVAPMSTAFSPDAFVESVVNKLKVNIDETDCY
ncbi:SAC3/GANP family protein [Histomonas meleagridis]|uniref:SAC3/GANP family protein n=1 Tax=Histomonas meleagridis TaxID=135588 RepID=UPI00355ACB0F|nr:SAC3/GANP family protein [Histomonas meleagridis]